ncbi:hydantoinase/oxoprolinase family protein [Nocardioides sp. W7]|uniref:hydantoinase/oxoprolinase family protein n=1 Tax=Nocardioides sp. W7 TaxID=2931390 RepID=UPI001FD34169|nr:hydantoinase/oxoprolinase family protein [Nocardioides sp. W7]
MTRDLRVGVDIGGTFTDIVVMDPAAGTTSTYKVLSTPEDPSLGMLQGIDELGIAQRIEYLVHGTTAGLNALLSRSGERTALITTTGFHDVLRLRRAGNDNIWSLRAKNVTSVVADKDVRTVRERVRFDGTVETPLDADDVRQAAQWLHAEEISTVAVCLLHAHRNPAHEVELRDRLLELLPDLSVVLSHEVSPEQGEYERTSTTVATAYVARTVDRYLTNLVAQLRERGCTAPLQVMRSSGGVCSAELVARQPIQTILSGPAGGVVAAETLARGLGRPNLIAIDMGGTSSDVSLVVDGAMTLNNEGEIADHVMRMPVVELHTIGAGGGSIARAEAGGLRVGPKSAGADPGPACYGLGGKEPTVTDAQVLLGRLDPDWFLGGRMTLDVVAAERAMATVGDELGLDAVETAEGILAVANAKMANAIRTLTLRRGVDPRDFTLVAFGGAGPLHSVALAEELGIEEIVIPYAMGVLSAWGMLHADVRHDVSLPLTGRLGDADARAAMASALEQLRGRGRVLLEQEGVASGDRHYAASVDMRYVGQEHAINVALDDLADGDEDLAAAFHETYGRHFGHAMPESPLELVNARLSATGRVGATLADRDEALAEKSDETTRRVRVAGQDWDARIVRRDTIGGDSQIPGPLVVQEDGSTTLVPDGWSVRRGSFGALIITQQKELLS